ncbi:MAG: hypothetical protein PSX71_03140 [bacterium]|nr:hypothetical protein [bacterium]
MKKSNALVQGLGTLALVSGLFAANQALANTAGGATIHNYATLTYGGGGSIKAAVNVGVQTVAAAPVVVKSTADQTVPSYGSANYTFTVASTSNGSDSFALALLAADVNTAGAPGVSFLLNGNPVSTLVLGGSVTSQPSGAGVIYIPAGSEANLSVNSVIKVGSNLYTIAAVTPGTPASTNTSTGVHTPEVASSLTLTPVGAAPAITAGSVVAGVQIGQQVTLTQHVVASAPVTVSSAATHTVSFTATSAATDLTGSAVVYSSASSGTNTITTVIVANTTLSKFVRNVTRLAGNSAATGAVVCNGAATYYAAGVVSKPTEVLEYCLKASVATGQPLLTAANLQDDVPAYTAYVAGTTTLNGSAVTEATPGTLPLSGSGLLVKSPGAVTAGDILPGETATVIFQVTVQ